MAELDPSDHLMNMFLDDMRNLWYAVYTFRSKIAG